MNCVQCNKETSNPKFCSKSCSVTYNNKFKAKRQVENQCKTCSAPVSTRLVYCKSCKKTYGDCTLREASYTKHHKSSTFAMVRTRARAVASKLGWISCSVCGYDKHIEIAHKKPIASYSLETRISEINHPDNLIALCPNCHWEFDHN